MAGNGRLLPQGRLQQAATSDMFGRRNIQIKARKAGKAATDLYQVPLFLSPSAGP